MQHERKCGLRLSLDTEEAKPMVDHKQYLGDGVYVSHDGYQLWLHVGAHNNPPLVALEPQVLAALNEYARQIARGDASGV